MTLVKKYDFVEIQYTGSTKGDNVIFDKDEVTICVGQGSALKIIEDQIIGKEITKEYTFEIKSEDAFGRKDSSLIRLIQLNEFTNHKINPIPGLHINMDGIFGIVRTVSGGRCLVDFNHPLSSKDLVYNVKLKRIIDDDKEKIKALLNSNFHIKDAEDGKKTLEIDLQGDTVNIKLKEGSKLSYQDQDRFKKIVNDTIPIIKKVDFVYVHN